METSAKVVVLASILGLLMFSVPLLAHHGTGISYDEQHPVILKGTVTDFRYANPHPQLFIDVKDNSGKVVNWGLELAPNPAQLVREGWGKKRSEETLKRGTAIICTVSPSKAGTTVGVVRKITTEEGMPVVVTGQ